jgi:glutathione S-transferase
VHVEGARFTDSIAILDEIERRLPGRPPFLTEQAPRTIDRLWEHFFNDSMYWLGFALRWSDRESREAFFRAVFGRMPAPARVAARWIMMARMARRAAGQGSGLKSRDQIDSEIARSLDMFEQSLAEGTFLQGRETPGRGDLAAASLLAQLGFRKTMPRWERRILDSERITRYLRDVYGACDMSLPRWLDPARSELASREPSG